jgi:hypothetical protein
MGSDPNPRKTERTQERGLHLGPHLAPGRGYPPSEDLGPLFPDVESRGSGVV